MNKKNLYDNCRIGWFGIPGGPDSKGRVHIVDAEDKPVCGVKIGKKAEFQKCSVVGAGALGEFYIDCERCKKQLEFGFNFCGDCNVSPCMCEELKEARENGSDTCLSCGCDLGLRGGYVATDLCGPCCTGEAATLDQKGELW